MGKVKIFPFSQFDISNDEMKASTRWGTEEAIKRICGIKRGMGLVVDESVVLSDIEGLTERHFCHNKTVLMHQG
jgi:hypothetical protein